MAKRFDKDAWIRKAIEIDYLRPLADGSIQRRKWIRFDPETKRWSMSPEWALVAQRVHKKTGRVYFTMTFLGHTKSVLTNRAVAWKFHPNPLNLPQVNHKDGDKENNAESNLEWSSDSDNERHAHRTGLKTGRGSANSNARLTAAKVLEIRASQGAKAPDAPWEGVAALAKAYGVARSTIINILNRTTWKHL